MRPIHSQLKVGGGGNIRALWRQKWREMEPQTCIIQTSDLETDTAEVFSEIKQGFSQKRQSKKQGKSIQKGSSRQSKVKRGTVNGQKH